MSDQHTRRDLLRTISASLAAWRTLAAQSAPYHPKALTEHEFATLRRLADLIIPADDRSLGALAAGAADFIDFLCAASDDMKDIYTGGLAWIDEQMHHRHDGKDFLAASPADQTAFLDLIAYRKNASPELNPGIEFFAWLRRMVADAYYTSPIGMKELGYMGNSAMAEFHVPKEAVEYALKRSPLA